MGSKDSELLVELAAALKQIRTRKLATQEQIGAATGVDQPTISRAKKGSLIRFTDKAQALLDFAQHLLMDDQTDMPFRKLANRFYAAGGTPKELELSVEYAITLISRRLQ